MPKVSIIIPVYNVENYLRKCIKSVLNQTLKDIEIICIDDGSTDGCPQILDEFSVSDKRIKVIHKQNEGYGVAMNIGMELASGEYVGIVESDDWILPEMYESLYNKAIEGKYDFVKCDFKCWWSSGREFLSYESENKDYYNRALTHEDFEDLVLRFHPSNWAGLYKKSFLFQHKISHNTTPGASYQDTGFRLQVCSLFTNAYFINIPLYMYRQDNPNSSIKSKQKMLALKSEYEFCEKKLDKKIFPFLNYLKVKGHYATFFRIEDNLKNEYIDIVKKDYINMKNNISYPSDKNSIYIRNWIEEISNAPALYLKKYFSQKQQKQQLLSSYKEYIVYGIGRRTIRLLDEYRSLDKLLFFVTSTSQVTSKFYGYDVLTPNDIIPYKNSALVIISVRKDSTAYNEIVKTLNDIGVSNVIDSEAISELIYNISCLRSN